MTVAEISMLITAIAAPLTGLLVAVRKAVNIAINREVIRRQAIATVEGKNDEIEELKKEVTERNETIQELRQEKRQLWAMLEQRRAPQ